MDRCPVWYLRYSEFVCFYKVRSERHRLRSFFYRRNQGNAVHVVVSACRGTREQGGFRIISRAVLTIPPPPPGGSRGRQFENHWHVYDVELSYAVLGRRVDRSDEHEYTTHGVPWYMLVYTTSTSAPPPPPRRSIAVVDNTIGKTKRASSSAGPRCDGDDDKSPPLSWPPPRIFVGRSDARRELHDHVGVTIYYDIFK